MLCIAPRAWRHGDTGELPQQRKNPVIVDLKSEQLPLFAFTSLYNTYIFHTKRFMHRIFLNEIAALKTS